MQFFEKNVWFQAKRFTGLLELIQCYKQTPFEKIFIFTIYQNYTFALRLFQDLLMCILILCLHSSLPTQYPTPQPILAPTLHPSPLSPCTQHPRRNRLPVAPFPASHRDPRPSPPRVTRRTSRRGRRCRLAIATGPTRCRRPLCFLRGVTSTTDRQRMGKKMPRRLTKILVS